MQNDLQTNIVSLKYCVDYCDKDNIFWLIDLFRLRPRAVPPYWSVHKTIRLKTVTTHNKKLIFAPGRLR